MSAYILNERENLLLAIFDARSSAEVVRALGFPGDGYRVLEDWELARLPSERLRDVLRATGARKLPRGERRADMAKRLHDMMIRRRKNILARG